jgi:hypothetical protein
VKPHVLVSVFALSTLAAPGARAQMPPPAELGEPSPAIDTRTEMWRVEMGYRGSYIPSAGYDPFSTNDFFPEFSASASRTVWTSSPLPYAFSFAPGVSWDFGNAGATARGDATSLTMHRVTIPLEGRYHLGRWGYAFLRVAPGLAVASTHIDDTAAPAPLTNTRWLFATDVSAGYAYLVWPKKRASTGARLWVQGDGGYGFVTDDRLALAPSSSSGTSQPASGVDLGTLSMSGGFFRLGAAVSF